VIERAKELLADYWGRGIRPTIRQIFYRLVSEQLIENTENDYDYLDRKLRMEREYGLEALMYGVGEKGEVKFGINPDSFQDTSRRVIGGDYGYTSIHEYFSAIFSCAERAYVRKRWANQPKQVIIWLEKEALATVLEDIAKKYRVRLIPSKGYSSFTFVYQQLVKGIDPDKPVVILLFTDFDPSGEHMVEDLKRRVFDYLYTYYEMGKRSHKGFKLWYESLGILKVEGIEIKKIALTREQVIKYNLPPNPAKVTDPRYRWFTRAYGDQATELDALPPEVLRSLVEKAIRENIDWNAWKEVELIEKEERQKVKEVVERLREELEFEPS